eukprot:4986099-Prymnesium_polylepis.1
MPKTTPSAHGSSFTFDTFLRCGLPPVRYICYADRVLPPTKRVQTIHAIACHPQPATHTTSNLVVGQVELLQMRHRTPAQCLPQRHTARAYPSALLSTAS